MSRCQPVGSDWRAGAHFGGSVANGDLDPGDRTYLAKLVAARTGLSQQDADKRVDDVTAQMKAAEEKAKQAADAVRKATAQAALFIFCNCPGRALQIAVD